MTKQTRYVRHCIQGLRIAELGKGHREPGSEGPLQSETKGRDGAIDCSVPLDGTRGHVRSRCIRHKPFHSTIHASLFSAWTRSVLEERPYSKWRPGP